MFGGVYFGQPQFGGVPYGGIVIIVNNLLPDSINATFRGHLNDRTVEPFLDDRNLDPFLNNRTMENL